MKLNICLITCCLLFFIELTFVNGVENVKSDKNVTTSKTIKNVEKTNYPKKVTALKKKTTKLSAVQTQALNKTISKKKLKPITDIFKDLPADDLAFIKELDKQFNLHGGKLKIKVQSDNDTNTKTNKRTIEGDLGYGYHANSYDNNGLKYVFYPYSQHDIPAAPPQQQQSRRQKPSGYYLPTSNEQAPKKERVTEVTIEPSYSYELKPQDFYQPQEQPQIDLPAAPQYQQQTHNSYEEPVIVLRIPGPTKYAAHLQALLQQYLEIRAAQYLQILEAHELRNQQQQYEQPQQHVEQQQQQHDEHPQQQYEQPEQQYEQPQHKYEQPQQQYEQPQQQYEQPQQQYEQLQQQYVQPHQEYGPPKPFATAEDHVKQEQPEEHGPTKAPEHDTENSYPPQELKAPVPQTTAQPQQEYAHQYQQQSDTHSQQQPEHYAYYNQVNAVYKAPIVRQKEQQAQYYYNANTQHLHSESPVVYLVPMVSNEYLQPQSMSPIYVQDHQHEQHLPITENNPRSTHTKVIYKPNKPAAVDHTVENYMLPTIRPYERHAPVYQNYYSHSQHEQTTPQIDLPYSQALSQEVIITQRPHKYRSHRLLRRGRRRGSHSSSVASTTASTFLDNEELHLRKIRNYVQEKFGAETGFSKEIPSKSNSQQN